MKELGQTNLLKILHLALKNLKQILLARTSETNSLKNSLTNTSGDIMLRSVKSNFQVPIWKSAIQELHSFNDKHSLVNQ